jgi:predicted O-methyltransferase YrrM
MIVYPNWFNQNAKHNFEKYLTEFAHAPDLDFLQVGAFTGDASAWMLENILTDNSSTMWDVDTWKGSPGEQVHAEMDFEDVFNTYLEKTERRTSFFKGKSLDFFMSKAQFSPPVHYDFIYIDGDHTTVGVLLDAELSWVFLKPNGIMAFDDYTWGSDLPAELTPTLGIDLFLGRHEGEYETLVINEQVWIKKNDN